MDNFKIDIVHDREDVLAKALDIGFCRWKKAVGYRVSAEKGFVLYWTASPKMTPFPVKMDAETVRPMLMAWLAEQDYGRQPDHDGSNKQGWRLYNEAWGHVDEECQAFLALKPTWTMYGK